MGIVHGGIIAKADARQLFSMKTEKTIGVDRISCAFNRAIYPLLAELILKDPELAEKFI